MNYLNIPAEDLHRFSENVFVACGYARDDAARAANVLHYADLRGHDTHGVANLGSTYCPGISKGEIRIDAKPRWSARNGACGLLDADGALGLLAAQDGMRQAIANARALGIGCVAVSNSTHFGSAGFYTDMALRENMIGIASTNLGKDPVANPMGSAVPLLGTNPLSFSAPAGRNSPPFSLDMSTTVVASGKIKQYARRQYPVPGSWLHDRAGEAATDPKRYLSGEAFLPMLGGALAESGAHKGMGLGLLVEILCGALSGAHLSTDIDVPGRNSIGHFFIAINPSFFRPREDFSGAVESLLGKIRAAPTLPGFAPLMSPGQPDDITMRERQEQGIPMDQALFDQLNALAQSLHVSPLTGEAA